MTNTRRPAIEWHDNNLNVLRKHVSQNANNLKVAFEKTAHDLGVGWMAVRSQYYTKIKSDPVNNRLMLLATKDGAMINTKNSARRPMINDEIEVIEEMKFEALQSLSSELSKTKRVELIKHIWRTLKDI